MCGECVAAPTQQEGMLDTHDTGRTGNPNLGGRPHTSSSLNSIHTPAHAHLKWANVSERQRKLAAYLRASEGGLALCVRYGSKEQNVFVSFLQP